MINVCLKSKDEMSLTPENFVNKGRFLECLKNVQNFMDKVLKASQTILVVFVLCLPLFVLICLELFFFPLPAGYISQLAVILGFMFNPSLCYTSQLRTYFKILKENYWSSDVGWLCEGSILASGLVCLGEFAWPFLGFWGIVLGRKYIPQVRTWFLLSPQSRETSLTQGRGGTGGACCL